MHILVVDDHPMVRAGLASMLSALDSGVSIAEAESCAAATALAGQPFDLVLLDLGLPDVTPLAAVTAVKQAFAETALVIISAESDPRLVWSVIERGASGYVHKTADASSLIDALRAVLHNDGIYVPKWVSQPNDARTRPHSGAVDADDRTAQLSERQRQIVLGVVHGKSNKVIARELGLQEGTVKSHLSSAFCKLGVVNRAQAAVTLARMQKHSS